MVFKFDHLNYFITVSNLVLMYNIFWGVGEIEPIQLLPSLGGIRGIGIMQRWVADDVYSTKCAFEEEVWTWNWYRNGLSNQVFAR